ncbi:unnamed protein product [Closterium sp. NIES-64]|nr:unnamed protein product [Closterium sp. NIES-64]
MRDHGSSFRDRDRVRYLAEGDAEGDLPLMSPSKERAVSRWVEDSLCELEGGELGDGIDSPGKDSSSSSSRRRASGTRRDEYGADGDYDERSSGSGRRVNPRERDGGGGYEGSPRTPPPRSASRGGGRNADEAVTPGRSHLRPVDSAGRPPSRGGPGSLDPSLSGRARSFGRRSSAEGGAELRPRTPSGAELLARPGTAEGRRPRTADVNSAYGRPGVPRSMSTAEAALAGPGGSLKERDRGGDGGRMRTVPRSASEVMPEDLGGGGGGGGGARRAPLRSPSGSLRSNSVSKDYEDERGWSGGGGGHGSQDRPYTSHGYGRRREEYGGDERGGGGGRYEGENHLNEEHRRLAMELEREREERRKLQEELKRMEREVKEKDDRKRTDKERRTMEKERLVADVAALKLPVDRIAVEEKKPARRGIFSVFSSRPKTPDVDKAAGVAQGNTVAVVPQPSPGARPVTPEGLQARLTRKNREVIRAARKEAAAAGGGGGGGGGVGGGGGGGGGSADQGGSVNILKRPLADVKEAYKVDKNELGRGRFGVIRGCMCRVSGERFACKSISKSMLQVCGVLGRGMPFEVPCAAVCEQGVQGREQGVQGREQGVWSVGGGGNGEGDKGRGEEGNGEGDKGRGEEGNGEGERRRESGGGGGGGGGRGRGRGEGGQGEGERERGIRGGERRRGEGGQGEGDGKRGRARGGGEGWVPCQQDIEDVRREVAVMEMLKGHPSIVNLRNAFEDAQDVHLIMELCEGGELFDRIKLRGKFPEADAARVIRTVVLVLRHCHGAGIMHRDLKPENILLVSNNSDTDLKVIDWGVATFFQKGKPCTDMAGSPYYLAPEVLAEKYGPEADIWSAGVVLYILLCGLPPFWGTTNDAIFEAIKQATLNLVRPPWPSISDEAKDLVVRMLTRNPKKRITAEEILDHPWIRANAS